MWNSGAGAELQNSTPTLVILLRDSYKMISSIAEINKDQLFFGKITDF